MRASVSMELASGKHRAPAYEYSDEALFVPTSLSDDPARP